jgi:hypothetical protein
LLRERVFLNQGGGKWRQDGPGGIKAARNLLVLGGSAPQVTHLLLAGIKEDGQVLCDCELIRHYATADRIFIGLHLELAPQDNKTNFVV